MEWVKCSDELPEIKDDLVLVCSLTGGKNNLFFPVGGYDCVLIEDFFSDITNGIDEQGNQLYTKWYLTQGITHWMYYPKLPTE
ncbi:DUF551 domain-containing protein [Pectobacterium odoriferum]|uniref:DUF551 domain-containing protein n=1 Tax=Pectobacterium odoriferum TaxID=78398 RepID=UPI0032F04B95